MIDRMYDDLRGTIKHYGTLGGSIKFAFRTVLSFALLPIFRILKVYDWVYFKD